MNAKGVWCLLATLLLLLTLVPANLAMANDSSDVDILITFHQPPAEDNIQLIGNLGGNVKKVFHIAPIISASIRSDKLNELRNDPNVKVIEPDSVLPACSASETLPWGVDRVDAELVHPTNKGTGVKVAVLDTGIDLDHPDLSVAGNVTFVPGTVNGDDDNGHGTMVAGVIGALDNDIGVIGVAPEAALYSVKVLNQDGDAVMSVVLSGLEWAIDNNMQVINMSFGGAGDWPEALVAAAQNAYNAGIVLVAGAGNGGTPDGQGNNVWFPARHETVIAVGATDEQDARYIYSSTGWALELMAPGVNIYSTAMGGGYGTMTGTSVSSPHVAGVAALLISSGMTSNADIGYRMQNSAQDLGTAGWDPQYGCGMVNADLALNFSEPPDQTAPVTTISLSGTLGNNGWYVSNVQVTLSATDSGSGVAETKYSVDSGATWQTYTSPFTITTEGWSNLVLARSWDNAGNDEGPPVFKIIQIDKTPPAVTETCDPTQMQRIKKGRMVPVSYSGTATDSLSGLALGWDTYLYDEYGDLNQDLGTNFSGTVAVEAWCKNNDANGRVYTFRLTASDYAGNQGYAEATCTVYK